MKKQIQIFAAAMVILTSGVALAQSEIDLNTSGKLDAVELDSNIATIHRQINDLMDMQNALGDSSSSGHLLSDIGQAVFVADQTLTEINQTGNLEESRALIKNLNKAIAVDGRLLQDLLNN